MRNPFARLPKRDAARPSLKERAANLKASAARVMKRQPAPEPASLRAGSPSPDLVALVAEWQRLLALETDDSRPDEEADPIMWERAALHSRICAFPVSSLADLAAKLPLFRDEVANLKPGDASRPTLDYQTWCCIVRDLEAVDAPSDLPGSIVSPTVPADEIDGAGLIAYEDAAGRAHRGPIAEWISYMALRLNCIARTELARKLDAACRDEPDQDVDALHDRLRKELRLDALHDFAFRSDRVFATSRKYVVGRRSRVVGDDADAELMTLGREFDAIHAEWLPATRAQEQAEAKALTLYQDLKDRRGWTLTEACEASWAEPGLSDAAETCIAIGHRMEAVTKEIRALPAHTLDGLAVKARAAIPAIWRDGQYQQDAGLGDREDWTELNARSVIDECLFLAGVDWTGRRLHGVDAVKA